jgi:hypothetical protein
LPKRVFFKEYTLFFSENHPGETLVEGGKIFLAVAAIQTRAAGLLAFLIDGGKTAVGILLIKGGGDYLSGNFDEFPVVAAFRATEKV